MEDKFYPDAGTTITREVNIKNRGTQSLYFKLAEGASIVKLTDGSYTIDDKQFYIKTDAPATIRSVGGKKELVVKVEGSSLKYSVIW